MMRMVLTVLVTFVMCFGVPGISTTASNNLTRGSTLPLGSALYSLDGRFKCIMQLDGNVVLYGPGNKPAWSTKTNGKKIREGLIFQLDDNLVLYELNSGMALWSSGTHGRGGVELIMRDNGNLDLIDAAGKPVWSTNTALIPDKKKEDGKGWIAAIVFAVIGAYCFLKHKHQQQQAQANAPQSSPASSVTPAPSTVTPAPSTITSALSTTHITIDEQSDVVKFDFGQPGVNVQDGYHKLGAPDGDSGTYTAKFTWSALTPTIKITGYTHTRGNYDTVVNSYSYMSNLLRSSFLRNAPGTMKVELTDLKPSTTYHIKTYHHSTSYARGGVEFKLLYEGNQERTLKQSAIGRNPDPPLSHTEIAVSSVNGKISFTMEKGSSTGNAHMDLNGIEIQELGEQEQRPSPQDSEAHVPVCDLPIQDNSTLSNTAAPPSYFSIFPEGGGGAHRNRAFEDDGKAPPSYYDLM